MTEASNRLTIVKFIKRKNKIRAHYICICTCGEIVSVRKDHYDSGHTRSCGCLKRENRHFVKHGGCGTRLHGIWSNMKQRCYNKKNTSYLYYGLKGIEIDKRWHQFSNFREWSLNNGYREDLTIDRIDSDNNYSPDNCQWISRVENIRRAHLGKKHIKRRK